jgi:hypothetical protein
MPRKEMTPEERDAKRLAQNKKLREQYAENKELRDRKADRYKANRDKINTANKQRYLKNKQELKELRAKMASIEG